MIAYFKRKSQNLSTAIEAIYGLRVSNDADKSLQLASETFEGMVDFNLENILKSNPENFINEIVKLNYSYFYLETIVKLLLETAEIYSLLARESDAINLNTKALHLLKHITLNDKTYSEEREQQIIDLEKKLF
ncbi:MAG TPA: hypothetical protein P5084_10075 [Paludibacter sp.]|nr:hypothetical protein [Paludibacter sp.]